MPEVTFSIRGERGAIDLLGWREDMGALAVVEVKTVLLDPGSLVAQVDRYRRLARSVSSERGWRPTTIGVWVVIAESTMNRRRYRAAIPLLRAAFPDRIVRVRRWLREPAGPLSGLTFLRCDAIGSTARGGALVRRVSGGRGRSEGGPKTAL